MLIDIVLGTRTSWKILLIFRDTPGKALSRRDIQQFTGVGNKVLTKFLLLLERSDILKKKKSGRTHYYIMNLSNPFVEHLLAIMNQEKRALNNLDFSLLVIIREFVYELTNIDLENLHQVVLFGSYAKRTYTKHSDVDIAIITEKRIVGDELCVTDIIDKLEKRFNKHIQPHYYTTAEYEQFKTTKKLVKDISLDGVRIY